VSFLSSEKETEKWVQSIAQQHLGKLISLQPIKQSNTETHSSSTTDDDHLSALIGVIQTKIQPPTHTRQCANVSSLEV